MTNLFSNPLLEVQSISKKAVEKSGQLIYDFFSQMQDKGYIESFEFEMKPYNNGYGVSVSILVMQHLHLHTNTLSPSS